MAIVKVKLMAERKRPTLKIKTAINDATALLDTGVYICMRFSSVDTFLSEFPDAKKSGEPIYKNEHPIISGISTFFQDGNSLEANYIQKN